MAGFQFQIIDTPDEIIITGASGCRAEVNEFAVSTSEDGIVLGFSFSGATIPTGASVATNLSFSGFGSPELCLNNGIISDAGANALSISYGDCVTVIEGIPGDLNDDGLVNVLDVVVLVSIVLGIEDEIPAGDLNSDGVINVLDVVILVNIILGG